MGLPAVAVGVARARRRRTRARGGTRRARRRGYRVGGVAGSRRRRRRHADAGDGRDGPGRGGGDDRTTRRGTPRERGRAWCVGMGRIRGVRGVGPAGDSRRVGGRSRAARRKLAAAGSNAATSARAAAEVASPATSATARRAGAIVAALLSHGAGQKHLWADSLFRAAPVLEGALAMEPAEVQLCIARLEQIEAGGHDAGRSGGTGDDARVGHGGGSARRRGEERVGEALARACVTPRKIAGRVA